MVPIFKLRVVNGWNDFMVLPDQTSGRSSAVTLKLVTVHGSRDGLPYSPAIKSTALTFTILPKEMKCSEFNVKCNLG